MPKKGSRRDQPGSGFRKALVTVSPVEEEEVPESPVEEEYFPESPEEEKELWEDDPPPDYDEMTKKQKDEWHRPFREASEERRREEFRDAEEEVTATAGGGEVPDSRLPSEPARSALGDGEEHGSDWDVMTRDERPSTMRSSGACVCVVTTA